MANPSNRQYNLRSTKQDVIQLPVQLQWSDDSKFLSDLLKKDNVTHSGQVTDSDSSIDEIDCEALIAQSDTELPSSPGPSSSKSGVSSDSTGLNHEIAS